jgi:hypothetical protein
VWWSGILAPAAAEGGGARPLGGLEHRAGAACRASEADRSGLETAPDARPLSYLWVRNTINTVVTR